MSEHAGEHGARCGDSCLFPRHKVEKYASVIACANYTFRQISASAYPQVFRIRQITNTLRVSAIAVAASAFGGMRIAPLWPEFA
jgi:hypothetical protein